MYFSSSENTTVANRPKLNVTYCLPTANYTLSVSNDTHGTVTVSPENATYAYGAVVTLTPVPASGYQFATWSGTNAEDPTDNGDGTWSLDDGQQQVDHRQLQPAPGQRGAEPAGAGAAAG